MQDFDLHVHSSFSDGKSSPEEIVLKAIENGLLVIGFSDHGPTGLDTVYGMTENQTEAYIKEISRLKEKYKNQIQIYMGIEQDCFSIYDTKKFDYAIGSVHYIKVQNEFVPIDESPEALIKAADKYFKGDLYKLAQLYFDTLSETIKLTDCQIIGHFDLITKFNENNKLFDETNDKYVSYWKKAADILLLENVIFEINTGAISRGYRSTPYPSNEIISYIKNRGGKFILSSDCHKAEDLCFAFDKIPDCNILFQKNPIITIDNFNS